MHTPKLPVAAACVLLAVACGGESPGASGFPDRASSNLYSAGPTLTAQQSGTTFRLQAVSPVTDRIVWASGTGATYTVTTDGGATWHAATVPGATSDSDGSALQFRDVEGVSDKVAYLLSAGVGTDSRIYKTVDGGATWTLQFQNQDPNGFYDCFAFWSPTRGFTMADSVNGRFPVVRTLDGTTWQDIGNRLPPAQPGEAGFAASGTCAATQGQSRGWLATGGSVPARVIATIDGGNSWTAYATPLVASPAGGAFTVAFRNPMHGIVAGGDLGALAADPRKFARSKDGGKTWELTTTVPFTGAVFGAAYAIGKATDEVDDSAPARTVVATGPGGAAWTPDEGTTWTALPGVANYWAVAFANPKAGWLVGTQGRILKISF